MNHYCITSDGKRVAKQAFIYIEMSLIITLKAVLTLRPTPPCIPSPSQTHTHTRKRYSTQVNWFKSLWKSNAITPLTVPSEGSFNWAWVYWTLVVTQVVDALGRAVKGEVLPCTRLRSCFCLQVMGESFCHVEVLDKGSNWVPFRAAGGTSPRSPRSAGWTSLLPDLTPYTNSKLSQRTTFNKPMDNSSDLLLLYMEI